MAPGPHAGGSDRRFANGAARRAANRLAGWLLDAMRRLRSGDTRRGPAAALGRSGEREAARHLKRKGYRILARNARVPMGEADLIARDPDGMTVVIVEVKTRIADPDRPHPPPEASVTAHKRRKLMSIAAYLTRVNKWHDRPPRIDVVAIDWPAPGSKEGPVVRHFVDAVRRDRR